MKRCTGFTRRQLMRSATAASLGGMFPLVVPAWAGDGPRHPLAPKRPHYAPRAKRVIMFFMTGGVSHVDSFDPKPYLQRNAGKPATRKGRKWKAPQWTPRHRGESGIVTTDLFPKVGEQVDDICFLRGMHGDHGDHFEATLSMHCGSNGSALPSMGAWVSYGLGTANPNLPSHVVFANKKPYAGAQVWDSNFLPAYHQGVRIRPGAEPIPYLKPDPKAKSYQDRELALLRKLNERHMAARPADERLPARTLAFDTAQSLQNIAPDVFTLRDESDKTLDLYGVKGRGDNRSFAWQCLMARRLAEREVRFIELIDTGSSGNWDQHSNIKRHAGLAKAIDQPIGALLADLKQRGMLEDTLVVWCTEFGRTPYTDSNPTGRGHWRHVFTTWLAGGGVRGGYVHGASDETGSQPGDKPVHVHDFHATILYMLGLEHTRLTYHYGGRDFRLTDVHGKIQHDVVA